MEKSPLDKQEGNDDHEIRIVRLEVKMDQLATALASLQRTVAEGFAEQRSATELLRADTQRMFEKLSNRLDEQSREHNCAIDNQSKDLRRLMDEQCKELRRLIDEQSKEHRRDIRWMTGLILTTVLATLGIAIRLLYLA